jgi:hypothetical protein
VKILQWILGKRTSVHTRFPGIDRTFGSAK